MSALDSLRNLIDREQITADEVFEAMFEAGKSLCDQERESEVALEISIRLLEARRTGKIPNNCTEAVELLAEECGLYPYIELDNTNFMRRSLIEAHAIDLHGKVYLHVKQMQILLWLLNGDNVILSAPTSFGKSLLVDAFISRANPTIVVMLLPTIALIDEYRRRLQKTFGKSYKIITTPTEPYNLGDPTLFVLTQERFLQRKDIPNIDLLFVDEFYKLDPDRADSRFETLNLAVYLGLKRAKQCFMAGPHIRQILLGDKWTGNFRFVRTDYRTVTVNVVDRSKDSNKFTSFLADLTSVGSESSLVFTATPGSAQLLMKNLVEANVHYPSKLGPDLGKWIASNYHSAWPVATGSTHGMAIHHGRLPRSLGQLFVHLFDQGEIKVLICTSTLIEGVNTAAANVFIYDKKISRTDFDFFSFANIRGRVGRMMRHFVGNAFLYHEAPKSVETKVDVPVLHDPGSSTDFIVINVDREELSDSGKKRHDELPGRSGLSAEILKEFSTIGVGVLIEMREKLEVQMKQHPDLFLWSGYPEYEQKVAVAELALRVAHVKREQTGIHSPNQVAWAWTQLAKSGALSNFLEWYAEKFGDGDVPAGLDSAFQFLQACEYSFPRGLSAVEAIVSFLRPDEDISYKAFILGMENWFRPSWMKQLDEAGVPIPLLERISHQLRSVNSAADAVEQIRRLDLSSSAFDSIDRFILRQVG